MKIASQSPAHYVTARQLETVKRIIADEVWLEGERRGRPVDPHDPVIAERVCAIVLRIGAEMRAQAQREAKGFFTIFQPHQ